MGLVLPDAAHLQRVDKGRYHVVRKEWNAGREEVVKVRLSEKPLRRGQAIRLKDTLNQPNGR